MKLVTAETGSSEARASVMDYLKKGCTLYTVDIALAEGLNAVWKHVKIVRDLKSEEVESTVQDLTRIYDELKIILTRELSEEATGIALNQNIAVYDSLYIASARRMKATLYTADQKLYDISKGIADSKLLKP